MQHVQKAYWMLLIHCEGGIKYGWFFLAAFNPVMEDPLPGHRKTQLMLKIISGQQLPKPKDSMFGDRGEVRAYKVE